MKRPLFLALAAVLLAAAPANPVTWKLTNAGAKPLKAGDRFAVQLTASVQEGWHFYSMKQVDEGPVPTRIWLADNQPFQLAAPVRGEEPEVVEDPTLHMEIEEYQGSAVFSLPLKVASTAVAGSYKLLVNAQTQSCNDHMCLPPATAKVELPITIGK
ncbi:MAG: protein-disulfide reductase DsbD domain-containing protein [Ignavibacteriota bacterium]